MRALRIAVVLAVAVLEGFGATVTAYCPCAKCCGKAGQPTASGKMPRQGVTIAAPRRVPLGTWVELAGVGRFRVDDRTARRYDGRWDVFMTSHQRAQNFGRREISIRVNQ